MGELTATAPLCFGTHQMEHVELEEFDHLAPEGKGSSVFQTCEALSAAEAELQREQVTDRLLLVQCRGDPDRLLPPAPERCYLSSTFVHTHRAARCTSTRSRELSSGLSHVMSPFASRLQQSIEMLLTPALDEMQGERRGERELYYLFSLIRSDTEREYSIQFT